MDLMSTNELDFAMNFEDGQQSEADKKLLAVFYRSTVHNEPKSIEAGRPIYDEIDLVKIITPGSRDSFIGDATEAYQQRFPAQWARYKAGRDQMSAAGTPLNVLPWLSLSQVMEFNAVGCHTVEQLVGMPDALSQKFMGHHAIKQRAKAYMDAAKEAAPTLRLQKELEDRDEQLRLQKETIDALSKRMAAMERPDTSKVPLTAKG